MLRIIWIRWTVFVTTSLGGRGQSGGFDVGEKLGMIGFQNLPSQEGEQTMPFTFGDEFGFFEATFPENKELKKGALIFQMEIRSEKKEDIAHWNAFITPNREYLFVESNCELTQENKESFVMLLDLAEQLGCSDAFIVVKKNNLKLTDIIRTYIYIGFQLVDPRVISVKDCVLISYKL